MPTTQLKPENPNQLRFLKQTFSNNLTFIPELLQNSRRAGAKHIHIECIPSTLDDALVDIKFKDDGIGITDLAKLLTCHTSDWDAELVAKEDPFGIGFFSALFACRSVDVRSAFGEFSGNCEETLNAPVVEYSDDPNCEGCVITLYDVNTTYARVKRAVRSACKGFGVSVTFDGQSVPNPDALCNHKEWHVGSTKAKIYSPFIVSHTINAYLHGMPIHPEWCSNLDNSNVIIHLDDCDVIPRMPDRQQLIDGADFRHLINKDLNAVLRKLCLKLIADDIEEACHKGYLINRALGSQVNPLMKHTLISNTLLIRVNSQKDADNFSTYQTGRERRIVDVTEEAVLPHISKYPQEVSLISTLFGIPYAPESYGSWENQGKLATVKVKVITEGKCFHESVCGLDVVTAETMCVEYSGDTVKLNQAIVHKDTLYVPNSCINNLAFNYDYLLEFLREDYIGHIGDCEGWEVPMTEIQNHLIEVWVDTPAALLEHILNKKQPALASLEFQVKFGTEGEANIKQV